MASQLATKTLIPVIVAACAVQLIWFGSKVIRQIDYDGMAYTGIAEQVRLWHVRDSLNAFRSPLISWLIATVPRMTVLHAGKLITILTFLLTVLLVYVFSFCLWRSHGVAATAALLMVLARGVTFLAVAFVTPDFLLSALVLAYFLMMSRCLRDERSGWWSVGLVHGIAFLAKAIALPWLGMCTLTAAVLSDGTWKSKLKRVASAAAFPIIVALLWGAALHAKYGVFTIGSQFKVNLLQSTLRGIVPKQPNKYTVLSDVAHETSGFVDDPMPPGSWEWSYRPSISILVAHVIASEMQNIPRAIKEFTIMSTPGVLLTVFVLVFVFHKHRRGTAEWILAITIIVGSIVLMLAYSMLVIDSRYLFPLIGLWFAVGARALWPDWEFDHVNLRAWCIILTVLGVTFSALYWSSPFRIQKRDWQVVCRQAGEALRDHRVATTVSVGSGPFPDHGVGWEAGYTSSYFGKARLLAASGFQPSSLVSLKKDILLASPEAVLVWDMNKQGRAAASQFLSGEYSNPEPITEPALGEVGLILFRK